MNFCGSLNPVYSLDIFCGPVQRAHELHRGQCREKTECHNLKQVWCSRQSGTVRYDECTGTMVPSLHVDKGSASQPGRRTLWGEQFQGTVAKTHLRAHWQQNLVKWPV